MYEMLATLLDYPGAELSSVLEACLPVVGPSAAEALLPFAATVRELRPGDMEELYTRTFDLQPENCLYIGHHLFGVDWRRSMFMARLKHEYTELNFPGDTELPDYIPTVLRFLAAHPGGPENDELLQDCVIPAVARLFHQLEQTSSPYAAVLRAVLLAVAPDRNPSFEAKDLPCRPFSSSSFPILP